MTHCRKPLWMYMELCKITIRWIPISIISTNLISVTAHIMDVVVETCTIDWASTSENEWMHLTQCIEEVLMSLCWKISLYINWIIPLPSLTVNANSHHSRSFIRSLANNLYWRIGSKGWSNLLITKSKATKLHFYYRLTCSCQLLVPLALDEQRMIFHRSLMTSFNQNCQLALKQVDWLEQRP